MDESREEAAYQAILASAANGSIKYRVPPVMKVGEPASVIVDLFGPNADAATVGAFNSTGSGTLKVIAPMLITLSEPGNPDAFKIDPDPVKSGNQFLPFDGSAEWAWTVTPRQGGDPKMLQIDAYMVLNAKLPNGQPLMRIVKSFTVSEPVQVRGFWPSAGDFLQHNWTQVLGYLLPSGAGATLLIFLFSRRKAKA